MGGGVASDDRLQSLAATHLLDTPAEESFDRLTRLASRLLGTPVSLVSLVDRDRQFFKSQIGLPEPWAALRETPLSHSFCQYVVASDEALVVDESRSNPLVADNLAIEALGVESYLGAPIHAADGQPVGTLCVIDHQVRHWTADDLAILKDVAETASTEIALRHVTEVALQAVRDGEADRRQKTLLLDSAGEGIYGIDDGGNVTFINRAASALLGFEPEEAVGKNSHRLFHHTRPDGQPFPFDECPMYEALRSGRGVRLVDELLWRRDGSSFPAVVTSHPLDSLEDGRGAVVTFSDETERRWEARRLAAQYRVAMVLAADIDPPAALQHVLECVATELGWRAALQWEPQADRLRVQSAWAEDESAERFNEHSRTLALAMHEGLMGEVWADGQPRDLGRPSSEKSFLRAKQAESAGFDTGVIIPVHAGNEVLAVLEFFGTGGRALPEPRMGTMVAISSQVGQYLERRRAEASLALANRAISAASIGITVSNAHLPDRPLILANRAFEDITGFRADEAIGRNCRFLQGPGTDPDAVTAIRAAVDAGTGCTVILKNYRKDGSEFWNELVISPVPGPDGQVAHFIGVQTDVSARIRAEAELREARLAADAANQTKSLFLANMSHELRTPLNAVIGYSELLSEEASDAGHTAMEPDLAKITSAGRHLLALINDVLDLSKIEAGRMEITRDKVSVPDLVAEIVTTIRPLADSAGSTMEIDMAPHVTTIVTDELRLRQILINLLSNAVKFGAGRPIKLVVGGEHAVGSDAEIEFCVADLGIGMQADQLQRLFEPFAQADGTITKRFGGTGLGLALARDFARLMGGELTVSSTPGLGSMFYLTIPTNGPGEMPGGPMLAADTISPTTGPNG